LAESDPGVQVGRPHAPIDPQRPLADFASGLLALKIGSKLTYKQMAQKTNFCRAVLCEAATGKRLPTLPVTLAYVRVCGGPVSEWELRWKDARDRLRSRRPGGGRG
jgi:hypothetical protein